MTVQVTALNSKGASAPYMIIWNDDRPQYNMERMLRTPVYKTNLVAFVVDEVHCVPKRLATFCII